MGLDISYHSGVEKVPDSEVPENVKPYNDAYEKWERETEDSTLYHISEDTHFYNHLHPLETGWYKVYDVRDEDGYRGRTFRGGSYTGYNQWYLKLHPTKEYDTSDMKWFNEKYDNFKEAFRVASNSKFGFVHFF